MIRVSVFKRLHVKMTDTFLERHCALGVDCLDFGEVEAFLGSGEQGYPDLDQVLKTRRRIRQFGMDINRVTLPAITNEFLMDRGGAEKELEDAAIALRVFAEAGVTLARLRIAGDTFPQLMTPYPSFHRGGYRSRGESLAVHSESVPDRAALEDWWRHFKRLFEHLVPIAEACNIRLSVHPSDTPNAETPWGGLGLHRVVDAFPSPNVGFVYCIGTRAEAGGSSLVMDEINQFGRKGRLFMVHMRNVRGSLATAGAFEEVLLDDGDLNMFRILNELKRVGFDGCINPDHIPDIPGDSEDRAIGWAYSVGYVKALLAALYA